MMSILLAMPQRLSWPDMQHLETMYPVVCISCYAQQCDLSGIKSTLVVHREMENNNAAH